MEMHSSVISKLIEEINLKIAISSLIINELIKKGSNINHHLKSFINYLNLSLPLY